MYSVNGHTDGINCLDAVGGLVNDCGPPEIVTGGRDGHIKVWDSRQNDKPVVNIEPNKQAHDGPRDCWSVAFGNAYNNHDRCIAASFDNGDVKLFDLRRLKVLWETNVNHGICQMHFNRTTDRIDTVLGSSVQGSLHIFRADRKNYGQLVWSARNDAALGVAPIGAPQTLWFVKHMPQNANLFATGNAVGHLHLWTQ